MSALCRAVQNYYSVSFKTEFGDPQQAVSLTVKSISMGFIYLGR